MGDAICSDETCDRKAKARGLCGTHYERKRLNRPITAPITERDPVCTHPGCNREHAGLGYCTKHYRRWITHGDTDYTGPSTNDRFWAKVDKSGDCWLWTGTLNNHGYGQFDTGANRLAHRYSYALVNGRIPRSVHLDHKCHNTACVNPAHLRPVTVKQNAEHRSGPPSSNTSGVLGVSWDKARHKWQASVTHHGRTHYVGRFTNLSDAEDAVIAKRNELFTHNDHDRMAG